MHSSQRLLVSFRVRLYVIVWDSQDSNQLTIRIGWDNQKQNCLNSSIHKCFLFSSHFFFFLLGQTRHVGVVDKSCAAKFGRTKRATTSAAVANWQRRTKQFACWTCHCNHVVDAAIGTNVFSTISLPKWWCVARFSSARHTSRILHTESGRYRHE